MNTTKDAPVASVEPVVRRREIAYADRAEIAALAVKWCNERGAGCNSHNIISALISLGIITEYKRREQPNDQALPPAAITKD